MVSPVMLREPSSGRMGETEPRNDDMIRETAIRHPITRDRTFDRVPLLMEDHAEIRVYLTG